MNWRIAIIFLVLIAFAPNAAADWGATNEGGFQEYRLDAFSQTRDNPPTGTIFSRSIITTPPHDYEITSSGGSVVIRHSAKFASTSTGIYTFQATWDGTNIPDCMWGIETTNQVITSTNLFPHLVVVCELTNVQLVAGTHTFAVSRSIQSGTPAGIDHETITYEILRTDLLEPSTMNDLIEFFNLLAPLLFFVGIVIWAEITREPLIYVLGVTAGIFLVVDLWAEIASSRMIILGFVALVATRGILAALEMRDEAMSIKENN